MTIELSPCAFCNNQTVVIDTETPGVIRFCLGRKLVETLPPGTICLHRRERPTINGSRAVPIEGYIPNRPTR